MFGLFAAILYAIILEKKEDLIYSIDDTKKITESNFIEELSFEFDLNDNFADLLSNKSVLDKDQSFGFFPCRKY